MRHVSSPASPRAAVSKSSVEARSSTGRTDAIPSSSNSEENEDARRDFLRDALARDELHAEVSTDEIETRLTELYRASRLAFEEGGANILYLCLGFLKWASREGVTPCLAPLMMLPVSLERKSVRSGFKLVLHEDDARFNPTLLQMLKKDFALDMPDVERDFATSLDVSATWRAVRLHVRNVRGCEVSERIVLSTLSFTKYLMWKDLVDRAADLKRNPVVRHLIETPTDAYSGGRRRIRRPRATSTARSIPASCSRPCRRILPSSRRVLAAQRGKDFVLFGPPGTGKSQTITNMIVNCLAHGKSVLFVSQRTAALEVVQRRLEDIGLGDYCLECHSTKVQKSAVVEQLARSWRRRTRGCRGRLDRRDFGSARQT